MKTFLYRNFGLIFVLLFAILASLPLLHAGFFPMHDDEQIARLFDLNQALSFGQFPPRLAPNLGYGYGYPFFNFYPSFAYYVGEIFHLLGFGFINSTKLMLFTGFLLSAYFAYLLGRDLFGEWAGVVTAAFYTFAPYHAVDIYVRGAFAEFFAFVFLPLIFWALFKLSKSSNIVFSATFAVGVCFLILSHNLIFIMSLPFVLLWFIYLIFHTEDKINFIIWGLVGLILGFGASAYFSIPSFLEKDFTLIRILTSELANYNLHFVCIHQLWNSPWGYGGSIPDCNDGLSFEVGKLHLIVSLAAFILFAYFYFIKKKREKNILIIPLFSVFLGLSMFFAVRQSKFIWDLIQPLSYIQFPWRFLTLAVFFSSVLAGSLDIFPKDKRIKAILSIALVLLVIVFTVSDFMPSKFINVNDNYYISQNKIRWDTSNLSYEYVPGKISTKKSKDNTTKVNISQNEIKSKPYKIIEGIMVVKTQEDKPQEKVLDIYSLTPGILRINTYAFPGWQVYINNKKIDYTSNNKLALIDIKVPFGKNTVKAVFENTPIRKFSNFVSILCIILICSMFVIGIKKKT